MSFIDRSSARFGVVVPACQLRTVDAGRGFIEGDIREVGLVAHEVRRAGAAWNVDVDVGDDHVAIAVVVQIADVGVAAETARRRDEALVRPVHLAVAAIALVQVIGIRAVIDDHKVQSAIAVEVAGRHEVRGQLVDDLIAVEVPGIRRIVVGDRNVLWRVERG